MRDRREYIVVGDIGTVIVAVFHDELGEILPIDDATLKKMYFVKPDGATVVEKFGTFVTDGTDGELQYTSEAGFFDVDGEWSGEGYVEKPAGKWTSSPFVFKVHPKRRGAL